MINNMSKADKLSKIEWENEIPFPIAQVKKTIKAMIGEDNPNIVLGLIMDNPEGINWNLNCADSIIISNPFGLYSFGQGTSTITLVVKKVTVSSTNVKVVVSTNKGGLYDNQQFLQGEYEKFNKAFGYYLEHEDQVDKWYNELKPKQLAEKNGSSGSGCLVFLPLILSGSMLAWYLI